MIQNNFYLIIFLIIWSLPLVDILASTKVGCHEKSIWIFLCLFASWFAWIPFYLWAPIVKIRE